MTARVLTALSALSALVASLALAAPADAAAVNGFGKEATTVAKAGGCKNIRTRTNGGEFAYRGLVCDLRGERLNILTFESKRQESKWLETTCTFLPDQWVTIGYGWVITAKNGNRSAAKTGERVYRGADAYLCSDLTS